MLLGLAIIAGSLGSHDAAAASYSDLAQLNHSSQQLIARVKAGTAEAATFRTDVVFYRESLRTLMLANEKTGHHKLSHGLLMKMVRMAALLQSAADCQTGRYITCPANLVHELDTAQQQLDDALKHISSSP